MNFQVILNEQTSIYIPNVDIVRYEDDTIIFRELEGNVVAAFKMYNIMGFFRMDVPMPEFDLSEGVTLGPPEPKHEWDFDKIDAITKKQQEEAEKQKIKEYRYGYTYRDMLNKAEHMDEERVAYSYVKDCINEIVKEGIKRGGIAPRGGNVTLIARQLIFDKAKGVTDEYEMKYLSDMLNRNMEHCLHGYDVYGESE